jgi:3-oxoacyl-[acyl-carrier-protein] synthase-3
MDGANIFNFTIKRVRPLIRETLEMAGASVEDVDYFIFHQSNQFIMKHLSKKAGLPSDKVPIVMNEYGNTGGASVPLTITESALERPPDRPLSLMLLGYGVGLSWGSALVHLGPEAVLGTVELDNSAREAAS